MENSLDRWLERTAYNKPYWGAVQDLAERLESDGCSGVPDWYAWACLEHDIHYRLHYFLTGSCITKKQADYILRVRIQQSSPFGALSPISWIRWLGVRLIPAAKRAWDKNV